MSDVNLKCKKDDSPDTQKHFEVTALLQNTAPKLRKRLLLPVTLNNCRSKEAFSEKTENLPLLRTLDLFKLSITVGKFYCTVNFDVYCSGFFLVCVCVCVCVHVCVCAVRQKCRYKTSNFLLYIIILYSSHTTHMHTHTHTHTESHTHTGSQKECNGEGGNWGGGGGLGGGGGAKKGED